MSDYNSVPLQRVAKLITMGEQDWNDRQAELAALREQLAQRQAFKEWVHAYLDAKGIPTNPPGSHGEHGCRIGDRMDYVFAKLAEAETQSRASECPEDGAAQDGSEVSKSYQLPIGVLGLPCCPLCRCPQPPLVAEAVAAWTAEMQRALDFIPAKFVGNDAWENGIKRMAESLAEAKRKLARYEAALNEIACWSYGPEVTSRFENPTDALIARNALKGE